MVKYELIYIALVNFFNVPERDEIKQKIELFIYKKHELKEKKLILERERELGTILGVKHRYESQIKDYEYRISALRDELNRKDMELKKQELEENLNFLSGEGWEIVQIPEDLMNLECVDGYVLCRKEEK